MKADRHAVKTIERRTACPIKKVYDTDFVGHSKGEFLRGINPPNNVEFSRKCQTRYVGATDFLGHFKVGILGGNLPRSLRPITPRFRGRFSQIHADDVDWAVEYFCQIL